MKLSLRDIDASIPVPSRWVKYYFDRSVTPDVVPYRIFSRYVNASKAIGASAVNTLGYGLVIISRITTAIIYTDFTDITKNCRQDAAHAWQSFDFCIAMSAYLFMSIIRRPGYELCLDYYPLKAEFRAPVLLSNKPLEGFEEPRCEIPESKLQLHADTNALYIDPITDVNFLLEVLNSRLDLVLVFSPDETNAYLVKRMDGRIRDLVMSGTLAFYTLSPETTPVEIPLPEPVPETTPKIPTKPPVLPSSASPASSVSSEVVVGEQQEHPEPVPETTPEIPTKSPLPSSAPPASSASSEIVVDEQQEHTAGEELLKSIEDLNASKLASSFIMVSSRTEEPEETLPPMPNVGIVGATLQFIWNAVIGNNHLSKEMKYRHVWAQRFKKMTGGEGLALYKQVTIKGDSTLKAKCLELYEIITQPKKYVEIRDQHRAFIYALREAGTLLKETKEAGTLLKETDLTPFKDWIEFLSLHQFAEINLYGYCKSLVETQTGPFNIPLTLDNFAQELDKRHEKAANLSTDEGLTWVARTGQRLAGHLNYKDFLIQYNIPYIYALIKINEKVVTILRHGTPIIHYALHGILEVTSDYITFIKAAERNGKKILHLILENALPKSNGGDESGRVKARLALGDNHANFYPLALRLDGDFIRPTSYSPKTIDQVRKDFENQMYGKDENGKDKDTGYHIPKKLQEQGLSPDEFKGIMERVRTTFFADNDLLETLQDFQAFIVLTYAEIILSLCASLKIDYLEAPCKDDIDRGGAMKAAIMFLHLYRSGKFAKKSETESELQQALEVIVVNFVGAAMIVRKDEVIDSRLAYAKNALEVIKRAAIKKPIPELHYNGNVATLSEPHQSVVPLGSTCRIEKEYQDYLHLVRSGKIVLKTKLNQHIVQLSSQSYMQTKDTAPIIRQLKREITGLNMFLNEDPLNPGRREDPEIQGKIFSKLDGCGIRGDEAWSVLSAFTQTIGADLIQSLQPLFDNNDVLNYIIAPDKERMLTDKAFGLYLTTKPNQASIKLVMLFKVCNTNDEKIIARIRTTIDIPDHRVAGATVTTTVDPKVV